MPRGSSSHGSRSEYVPSRRRLLQLVGATMIGGLAGCSRDTDNEGDSGGETGGNGGSSGTGKLNDPEFTLDSLSIPASDVQWNDFNFSNYKWMIQAQIMDPFAVYDPANDKFVGLLADDWTIDVENQKLTVKLDQNYHWHDGEKVIRSVTAKDVYTHFQLEQYMGWSSSEYTSKIEPVDTYTVEFALKGGYTNKDHITWNLLMNVISHGLPEYREWAKKFESASSESETEQVMSKLSSHSISSEEVLSYGPFAVKGASKQKMTAVKNEGHPAAEKINFPRMAWRYLGGSSQKVWQALSSGILDGRVRMSVPKDVQKSFPEHIEHTTFPSLGGSAVVFKWNDEVFGDPRVRRALAYVLDKQRIAENVGIDTHKPIQYNTGMAPEYNWKYLDKKVFTPYTANTEKATTLLTDAGFTREGEAWYRPDGTRFGAKIKMGATGGLDLLTGQTVSNQLKRFGIDTQIQTMESTSFTDNVWEKGNFRIALLSWGADYPTPYSWYNSDLLETRKNAGIPKEIKTPPIGRIDGATDALTIDLDKEISNLTKSSGKELKETTTRIAWAYSSQIPRIQLYETMTSTWFTNDDWTYPSLDSDIMQRRFYTPLHYIIKTGAFKAKTA